MDNSELLAMKAALLEMTATRGWSFFQKFAETVVRDLETKAVAEEDDVKANGLRRDARGARKFKDELFRRVELAKSFESQDSFIEVATD